ncbi:hypothetical protein PIB30_071304 [Stylosanthes scabra]|uniref:Uncharacterized protein n=1 Tax=Stylosanthes scabra TaxID=79078 RepID=A0ABU6TNE2_9FABA|nr:hypothetical protein [Stylosanthes scabra]
MTHKKSDGSFIHEDAQIVAEAIQEIEGCDQSSNELSQDDSLAQRDRTNRFAWSIRGMADTAERRGEAVEVRGGGTQRTRSSIVLHEVGVGRERREDGIFCTVVEVRGGSRISGLVEGGGVRQ